jgi:hypothetical protein
MALPLPQDRHVVAVQLGTIGDAEPGDDERASLSGWANPGTDSQIPANCAGNWCQSRVCDAFPASFPQNG